MTERQMLDILIRQSEEVARHREAWWQAPDREKKQKALQDFNVALFALENLTNRIKQLIK